MGGEIESCDYRKSGYTMLNSNKHNPITDALFNIALVPDLMMLIIPTLLYLLLLIIPKNSFKENKILLT
jgi:hypothetical protein